MKERGVGRPERAARRGCAGGLGLPSALRRALPCLALALACLTGATGRARAQAFSADPDPVQFPPTAVGSRSDLTLTITNDGNATLVINGRTQTGDNAFNVFDADSNGAYPLILTGNSRDSATYHIGFVPETLGPHTGTLIFKTNDSPSQQTVTLQGTGVAPTPQLSFSSTSLDFGQVRVGDTSPARSVTVTNSGNFEVQLSVLSFDNTDFREYDPSGQSVDGTVLAPGESSPAAFKFRPTASGQRSVKLRLGAILVLPGGGVGPSQYYDLRLTGTGVIDTPTPTPTPTPIPTPAPPPVTGPTVTGYAATNPKGVAIVSGPPGAPLLILGSRFGTGGSVAFNGLSAASALSWSPTEIVVTIPTPPSYPFTGPVTVTVNGQTGTGPPFSILAPANPTPAPVVSADWPVFGHDPQQVGATSSALDPRTLGPWSFALGSPPGNTPVVLGGFAYLGTEANGVFAIDTATHTQRWNRPLPTPVRSSLAAGADAVVVSAEGLYGLSPKDGSILWQRPDLVAAEGVAPMRAGDTIYLGARGPGGFGFALYAVLAATGANVWPTPATLPAAALSTAAVDVASGRLFVAIGALPTAGQPPAGPSAVLALRVSDGAPVWPALAVFPNSPAPAGLSLGLVAGGGGVQAAVFVAAGNAVTALNAATGAVLWSRALPETSLEAPPIVAPAPAGATLFVGGGSGKIYALSANTGADMPGGLAIPVGPLAGTPALAGTVLFLPTSAGVVAVDTATGTKIWTGEAAAATGVAIAGGSLFVGTTDGRLAGFSPGIAPPSPPSPSGTADVAITALQVPATVSRSSDALVKVTLVNRGGGSVSYSLSLRVQPGNLLIGAVTGTLAAGETREVPFTWGTGFMGSDGVKVLLAQVELVGATDAHPDDNILTQPVTVGP